MGGFCRGGSKVERGVGWFGGGCLCGRLWRFRQFGWIDLAKAGVLDGVVDEGGYACDFGKFYLGRRRFVRFLGRVGGFGWSCCSCCYGRLWFWWCSVDGVFSGRFVVKVIAEAT